jgi:sugar O-acyltransferase (sialic acid O-acetyltransferase NeuD family)
MDKQRKLIIVGDSSFAEIAYEYFTHDSSYSVEAFSVERPYLKQTELFGLPIVPFDELREHYHPNKYDVYIAIVYTQLNRLRTRLYMQAKQWGYHMASYVSSQAFVWPNVKLGNHCFIFENNVVQPFVQMGNNIILWSGNHIGHHSIIQDNCFISSHVVISGHCNIGKNCFFGVNSTVANQVTIQEDCVLGAGSLIMRDTLAHAVYKGNASKPAEVNSFDIFKVPEEQVKDEVA